MAAQKAIKIHYRRAVLLSSAGGITLDDLEDRPENPSQPTLQKSLEAALAGPIGKDARERVMTIASDSDHRGCLNYSQNFEGYFACDLVHLDGRRVLPMWLDPRKPEPVARVIPRKLADGEQSLAEPVYLLVKGNHVAVVERMAFRNSSVQHYVNALLRAAGQLDAGTEWHLAPRIEAPGGLPTSPVHRIVFKSSSSLVGGAPSQVATETGKPQRPRTVRQRVGDLVAEGRRVIDMAVAAGADQTKIQELQRSMSQDLALRARLEITVDRVRRKSEAQLGRGVVEQALAELTSTGDVTLETADGKVAGKLIQLAHTAQVTETGGMLDWDSAVYALVSAMTAWAARRAIVL